MCFLRGIVFKNLHNIDVAKQCFKEALRIDVKCYDALDIMISNNMLTTSEGTDGCAHGYDLEDVLCLSGAIKVGRCNFLTSTYSKFFFRAGTYQWTGIQQTAP